MAALGFSPSESRSSFQSPFFGISKCSSSLSSDPCPSVPCALRCQHVCQYPMLRGELTFLQGCRLTGHVEHITVCAIPSWRTQAVGPCLLLNTSPFVFTWRSAAEVHQGLKRRQGCTCIKMQIPEMKPLRYSVARCQGKGLVLKRKGYLYTGLH